MRKQRQFFQLKSKQENEINLSPLIDLIFILLIFFIVTAAIVNESGIRANTPDISADSPSTKNDPLLIELAKNGEISSNGNMVPLQNLESYVRKELVNTPRSVIVAAAPGSSSELAIQIMDYSYLSGAERVALRSKD